MATITPTLVASTAEEWQPKTYYCGCNSRDATMGANGVQLLGDFCFLTIFLQKGTVYMNGLSIYFVACALAIHSLGLWGVLTYRRWPVMISLGLTTGIMVLIVDVIYFGLRADAVDRGRLLETGVVGLLIQYFLFWLPMRDFVSECEKLRRLNSYEVMETEETEAMELT